MFVKLLLLETTAYFGLNIVHVEYHTALHHDRVCHSATSGTRKLSLIEDRGHNGRIFGG